MDATAACVFRAEQPVPQILCRELPEFQWGRGGLATDEIAAPLGGFFYFPGLDQRPEDTLPHSDVSRHHTPRRGDGAGDSEARVNVSQAHLDAIAARAKAGLPLVGGYHGARTLAGFDAE